MESVGTKNIEPRIIPKSSSNTQNDKIILLGLFPEKVWLTILKKVKVSDDLIHIADSSPFFRNLLLSQRTLFLFPKVWQILGMVYETSHDPIYMEHKFSQEKSVAEGSADIQSKAKFFSGMLKYRQVCKDWCTAVDDFYKNYEGFYRMRQDTKFDKKRDAPGYGDPNEKWTRLWSADDATKFYRHFNETHESFKKPSPFLANAMSLNINYKYDEDKFSILEEYSEHVWHCHLNIQEDTFKLYIHELHGMFPSLRSLRISYNLQTCSDVLDAEIDIGIEPYPSWENLKYLEADNVPGPVFKKLLKLCSRVEMLEMRQESKEEQIEYNFLPHFLPNLSQISFEVHSREYFYQLKNALVHWKLEKVYISFKECCFIKWSEIFHLLEDNWAEAATNVALHMPKARTSAEKDQHMYDLASLQLYLPNLKRLKLVLENAPSIDFILPMKNTLAQLEVTETETLVREIEHEKKFQEITKNQQIEFQCFQKNFYFSNVWNMLPVLLQLQYDNDTDKGLSKVYTRPEWLGRVKK